MAESSFGRPKVRVELTPNRDPFFRKVFRHADYWKYAPAGALICLSSLRMDLCISLPVRLIRIGASPLIRQGLTSPARRTSFTKYIISYFGNFVQ